MISEDAVRANKKIEEMEFYLNKIKENREVVSEIIKDNANANIVDMQCLVLDNKIGNMSNVLKALRKDVDTWITW